MSNGSIENKAKTQSIISGLFLTLGFIGWRVIRGQSLGIEDMIAGVVFGGLVGIVSYTLAVKKQK